MNKKMKIAIIIIALVLVVLIGCNVYATTQGYENIFFMIKYAFTNNGEEKIVGKEELLKDRDIVISNDLVKLSEEFELKIEKIQIKDNQSTLKLEVHPQSLQEEILYNFNYKVLDENDKVLCEKENNQVIRPTSGYIFEDLELKDFKDPNGKLKLEVSTKAQRILVIKIDLAKREVVVESALENQKEPEKISEIELKKYLKFIPAKLEYESQSDEVYKVIVASIYYENNLTKYSPEISKGRTIKKTDRGTAYVYDKELIDTVLKTMGFGAVKIENNKNDVATLEVIQENGKEYYQVIFMDHGTESQYICLDIVNLESKGDVYKVTFNYYYTSFDVSLERKNADIRQMTVTFVLNEEGRFTSKYKLKEIIEDKVSVKAENEFKLDWVKDIIPPKDDVNVNETIANECKEVYKTYNEYDNTYVAMGDLYYKPDFEYIYDDSKIPLNSYGMEYYVKTNESYKNYEKEMLKIVSNRFYNENIKKTVKNIDGTLYLLQGGGFTYEYRDILEFNLIDSNDDFSKLTYDIKILTKFDDGAPSRKSEETVSFVKENGRYVVNQINHK